MVAHRGLPNHAPENSAAGFVAARQSGAACVEFDLRPTADRQLIVLHDETPERLTGDATPALQRSARALIEQRFRAAPDQSLLLLDEALALLAGRVALDLELKATPGFDPGLYAELLLQALVRAGSPQQVVATSSDLALLAALRARAPRLATGFVAFSDDPREPIASARDVGAALLVISRRRVTQPLVADAHRAGLVVWTYTVNDRDEAERLLATAVDALISDDEPRLRRALGVERAGTVDAAPLDDSGQPLLMALDLGSSATKGAIVSPQHGVLVRVAEPTPSTIDGEAFVHDPLACLAAARRVVAQLQSLAPRVPCALGIASQRSTGIWIDAADRPLTPAPSWRDRRTGPGWSEWIAARAALEAETGFPLAPAWTAIKAGLLLETPPAGARLVPLGAWIAGQLLQRGPVLDPTLANRMFLISDRTLEYSPLLLAAFGLDRAQLAPIVPSVFEHGSLPWGDCAVPCRAVIGDQQAAYVGAAGPLAARLVLNLGTAVFVMRLEAVRRPGLSGARRAPLWTSSAAPRPTARLVELPLIEPPYGDETASDADRFARETARRLAFDDPGPDEFVARIAAAVTALTLPQDQSITVSGGGAGSPHLAKLLARQLPLTAVFCRESETTLLGAARLAAAGARIGWGGAPGGGASPRLEV